HAYVHQEKEPTEAAVRATKQSERDDCKERPRPKHGGIIRRHRQPRWCGRVERHPKQKEQARGCRGGDEAAEGIETCRTTESGFGMLKSRRPRRRLHERYTRLLGLDF